MMMMRCKIYVTLLFQLVAHWEGTGWFLKSAQDGDRTKQCRHVAVLHGHVWRTVCSVCATGARVAQSFPSKFIEVSPAPITLLFQVVVALDWYVLV
jgi:hypothetical protein